MSMEVGSSLKQHALHNCFHFLISESFSLTNCDAFDLPMASSSGFAPVNSFSSLWCASASTPASEMINSQSYGSFHLSGELSQILSVAKLLRRESTSDWYL